MGKERAGVRGDDMARVTEKEAEKFAAVFLKTMDAEEAAKAIGRDCGGKILQDPKIQEQLRLQREFQVRREDVTRRLAELAYGRANDCVRLVLEEGADIGTLDLNMLAEVKRSDRGGVEVKLVDRLAVLEQLEAILRQEGVDPSAFLRALGAASQEPEA